MTACESGACAKTSLSPDFAERRRLNAIATDPKSPHKHIWRTRIVLLSGEGLGTLAIMAATAKSKTRVWRWRERFMHEGVDGLLSDRSRPPGKAPVPPEHVAEIIRTAMDSQMFRTERPDNGRTASRRTKSQSYPWPKGPFHIWYKTSSLAEHVRA